MKKVTLFRTGEYETLSGKLLPQSAYQLFAQAQALRSENGDVSMIMTSHIPEAVNSARIIQMVMQKARITENPRLSRYHAGSEKRFLKDFLRFASHLSEKEHIVLVSHNQNITNLTNRYVPRGANLTIEAPSWEEMFDLRVCSISIAAERLARLGIELPSSWEELLSAEEKMAIDELSFVLS